MGWPQIVVIVLLALNFGFAMSMHGKPREGNHNVIISLISLCIWLPLLIVGGFFSGGQ